MKWDWSVCWLSVTLLIVPHPNKCAHFYSSLIGSPSQNASKGSCRINRDQINAEMKNMKLHNHVILSSQHHTTKKHCSLAQSAMKFQLDAIMQISWHPAQTEAGQDCRFGLTCLKCILKLCISLFWSALFGTALRDVRAGRITPLAQQYQLYYLPNAKFQLNPIDQLWMEDIALSLPWSL